MDVSRFVSTRPSHPRDELIARAARSWNPDFPGRREIPQKYAAICRTAMIVAESSGRAPQDVLSEVCRFKCVDESEVIAALEAIALRIEEEGRSFKEKRGMQAQLTSMARSLFGRLR